MQKVGPLTIAKLWTDTVGNRKQARYEHKKAVSYP